MVGMGWISFHNASKELILHRYLHNLHSRTILSLYCNRGTELGEQTFSCSYSYLKLVMFDYLAFSDSCGENGVISVKIL